ncbi:MAG: rod-binding protein [Lachnospiraceae bacterium]|nr:rod-binding protein [Lachnospiraceae bacterium]
MDISGITAAYADIYTKQQNQTASKLETELDADFTQKTEDELMDACKEFEAYFLEMMFKEMMNTIPKDEDSASSYASGMMDYYQDSMLRELAGQSTESSPMGLAQMLYEQMKRNYGL